ncbi:MAG: peptidoglycan-binding protein [Streptomyces sp.]|jgi:hypothetical protein|nr:peptidoglycan-binding protein [Streptomyces sp.]
MTRSKRTADEPEPRTATPKADTPSAPTAADASRYEPYPGAAFFHGGRYSDLFTVMGRRLAQEGCGDGRPMGPNWTNAHRHAFAAWQQQMGSGDVSGIPDQSAWDQLRIPRVSPLPKES